MRITDSLMLSRVISKGLRMVEQIVMEETLLMSAKEVFETMIFMDLQESSEPDQTMQGNALLGSITFKGSIEGCLTICCSVPCAQNIAANMLGMDPTEDISYEEISDAMGEVTNMVMGSVKSRLKSGFCDLQVSIPIVISGQELDNSLSDDASKVSVRVSIDEEYIARFSLLYRVRIPNKQV